MNAVERIREWLNKKELDGVLLGRRDNYAWVSSGAKNHVVTNGEEGVAYYVIKKDAVSLIADSSDLPRMLREQNPLGAEGILVPWYESMEEFIANYIKGEKFVSDNGVAGTLNVQEELIDLRLELTGEEAERYKEIGQLCANIVEGVCMEARPGQTETEIAQILKCRCIENGISPDCVLVGADERIMDYRHPMPADKKIGSSLMVVLGGEKYGLNISMTRMVYFEEIPEEIKERYKKTQYIFACMQMMMKDGMPYKEYFENVQQLYKEAGYDGEWKMHHQGGPTGYGCREFVVTPDNEKFMHKGQAYAWNPTIQGTKCEETTYMDGEKIQVLTRTGSWPLSTIATPYGNMDIADILTRNSTKQY